MDERIELGPAQFEMTKNRRKVLTFDCGIVLLHEVTLNELDGETGLADT